MTHQTEVKTAQELSGWYNNVFIPWKNSVEEQENTKHQWEGILQNNSSELKKILTLLLDKREKEATRVWNAIKSAPGIKALSLNLSAGELAVVHEDDGQGVIMLNTIIDALAKNNLA